MKKKALITMGCSFTEGVGCYDYSQLPDNKTVEELNSAEFSKYYGTQLDNFLEGSWGTHLQKLMGYDLHINCGIGGSSNSHQLKNFMDTMANWPDLTEYDVLVIWQMTYSHRFSFYEKGVPTTFGFNGVRTHDKLDGEDIPGHYNNFVKSFIHRQADMLFENMALESLFHLRCFIEICKSKGYSFLFSTVGDDESDEYINKYLSDSHIDKFIQIYDLELKMRKPPLHYAFSKNNKVAHCGHPMSDGYKSMANKYFEWISSRNAAKRGDTKDNFVQIPMNRDYNILVEEKKLI